MNSTTTPDNSTGFATPTSSFEAFLPNQMARKAEDIGANKSNLPLEKMFLLSVLAGAFIALGAIFATTVTADSDGMPFGISRLLGGVTFSLGLILVVVAGAELFTGNNLVVMAMASRKTTLLQMLKSWVVVYIGNFVGAIATAAAVLFSKQWEQGDGIIGARALDIANAKCSLGFVEAFFLGVLCNALVCLAIWLCYSARTTTDKVLSILPPITAFVAAGFEHSIANMYFIPIGILIDANASDAFWQATELNAGQFTNLNWGSFVTANLVPVTLGNVVGGSVMVGLVYWFIYLRNPSKS